MLDDPFGDVTDRLRAAGALAMVTIPATADDRGDYTFEDPFD
ncbi:hypothetical protein [Dactylosporangium sp. NPDC049140]